MYAPYKILGIKETWAAEIKLRAWRRMGEISAALPKSKGGKNPDATLPMVGRVKNEVLEQAGITTQDALPAIGRAKNEVLAQEGVSLFMLNFREAGHETPTLH